MGLFTSKCQMKKIYILEGASKLSYWNVFNIPIVSQYHVKKTCQMKECVIEEL